jgi:hypothetical protein
MHIQKCHSRRLCPQKTNFPINPTEKRSEKCADMVFQRIETWPASSFTWKSRICFCCSDCHRPMSLRSSPTIVPTLSVTDSATAFPRKNAFRTSLFSPAKFQKTQIQKDSGRSSSRNFHITCLTRNGTENQERRWLIEHVKPRIYAKSLCMSLCLTSFDLSLPAGSRSLRDPEALTLETWRWREEEGKVRRR